jgi:hypothetical protein
VGQDRAKVCAGLDRLKVNAIVFRHVAPTRVRTSQVVQ